LRRRGKVVELDVASLLWEQFLLALPAKTLCDENCPGCAPGVARICGTAPAAVPRKTVTSDWPSFKTLKAPRGAN